MLTHRIAAFSMGLFLLVPFAADADTCATMEGSWTDNTGVWSLSQDSQGTITGLMSNKAGGACPTTKWGVTGRMRTGGDFQFRADWNTLFTRPPACSAWIAYSGHINQPGCNKASGNWSNDSNIFGSFNSTQTCRVPTGESTPVFQNWGSGSRETIGMFQQYIQPAFNYGGRYVYETFLGDAVDTCHFTGSRYAYAFKNNGSPQYLSAGTPTSMIDSIGMAPELIFYYRVTANRSPCQYVLHQRMKMDCDTATGDQTYKVNDLTMRIEYRDILVGRGPTTARKRWGQTPVASFLTPLIEFLLDQAESQQ